MRIFRHYHDLPEEARRGAVAIGNFDGLHLGHRSVIEEAGRIAEAAGIPWAVLTFEPHPRSVFWPDTGPFRLTPFRAKARLVEEMGVDCLVVLHFDQRLVEMTAEDFVADVLVSGLAARHVVSGYDFVFGHRRAGNCELLLRMGQDHGFDVTAVQAVRNHGEVCSSTRLRRHLREADPRAAARMLGRPFEIEGRIERGDERGAAIGFPTANLHLGDYLHPAEGVYAVRAAIGEGAPGWLDGVANLGHRPTFPDTGLILETHLFGFNGDIYGQHLRVALIDYLRREKKFDGIDGLKAQIAEDCERARRLLAREPTTDEPQR